MKAKEFKKYQNYALYIEVRDLDYEFSPDGIKWENHVGRPYTEKELEVLWEKEVISFDMRDSNISWGDGRGPKVLELYVSNLTEEERRERKRQKAIEDKMNELSLLTGRDVILGEIKAKSIDDGEPVTFTVGTITGE